MVYIPDSDEKILRRYMYLSLAIDVIKLDLEKLRNQKIFKIQEPYVSLLESVEMKAHEERKELNKLMYQKKLQVVRTGRKDGFTEYTFYSGTMQEKHDFNNAVLRNHTKDVLEELFLRDR